MAYTSNSYAPQQPSSSSTPAATSPLPDATTAFSRYLASLKGSSVASADYFSKYSPSSSMYDSLRFDRRIVASTTTPSSSWPLPPPPPPGVDIAPVVDSFLPALKRSSEAFYLQSILGAHNTIGQTEAWYSTNPLTKRPRLESASNLPIYPQRPGEKDCAHYMLTRTCKFGDICKFDHPVWVPEGGIPDWKEVPVFSTSDNLPERPGEPDCPYFLKTQRCKYGLKCKFNHPKENLTLGASESKDVSVFPERPSEPPCAFYMKTGKCKFGTTCKFHHPKDTWIPSAGQENGSQEWNGSEVESLVSFGDVNMVKDSASLSTALYYNSKGLPIRMGELDCPFYLKTGSCKYGATCRYNHPDRLAINPPVAAISNPILAPAGTSLSMGINPAATMYQQIDPRLAQPMLGLGATIYPQRPGRTECEYYMKTGVCKFGERCKFHHPIDRSEPIAKPPQHQNVKLTLAGLPRREGAVHCPYYMKTGACKYGATCKFDHPPPGEVMAIAASQVTSMSSDEDDDEGDA
ncbi:hypothetical protein K2173_004608 [Erythroxylum novogranatense]|uniref:C3H1-type domain-containing protein n=1 Tax=Erythroxylum novogranatense TaxID=1862640 RepID=A0AAV8T607_9ROSI|nr:hypothetical protein K2173_004608 [Erythroxylum novogranatense]